MTTPMPISAADLQPLLPELTLIAGAFALLMLLSAFHYYTAGFGLLREATASALHVVVVSGHGERALEAFDLGPEGLTIGIKVEVPRQGQLAV